MFVSGSNMTGRALHKRPDSKRVGEGPPPKQEQMLRGDTRFKQHFEGRNERI